jgi:RNA-directed DNA polymerase
MGRLELQASSGLATTAWHQINWASCHRQGRSLQRRIVPAIQAGVWRKVKRLSYLVVHAFAGRALAVTRVIENTGQKTPGVDEDLWDTPAKKAHAVARIGRWRGDRPAPLKRIDIPKQNGTQRPRSTPTLTDRARPAVSLHALQPMAEPTGDHNSCGFRPKRRCADAIDQGLKVLRQTTSATWILAGDIPGVFDTIRVTWLAEHIPMNTRMLSRWLHRGFLDRGTLVPTTAGVPPGGMISPVISNMVWDGLETVVHGGSRHRRVHHLNDVRWADDFIVTATSRQVLEDAVLPRINALLAKRGGRRSPTKTVITPSAHGFDFLGQTRRNHERPHGKPGTRQMTPRQARVRARKARIKALCKQRTGRPPAPLIATLHPVWRGWANDHRPVIWGATFATLDNFVWQRLYRWARGRHPHKTGRGIAEHDCPHQAGKSWRCTDPVSGQEVIRVREAVKPRRHVKGKGDANPFDPIWAAYFPHRARQLTRHASSPGRADLLRQQNGRCPVCRQVIQGAEALELHHRDGHHQDNRSVNLVFLHPNGHRQVHSAPGSKTGSPRSLRGAGHACAACRETGPLRSEGAGWARAHLATRRLFVRLSFTCHYFCSRICVVSAEDKPCRQRRLTYTTHSSTLSNYYLW